MTQKKLRPIFYDTETTGIRTDRDRIVEIAAFDPEENRTFVSFVNPQMPIPPESTAITNITDSMVADAPLFSQVAQEFVDFCGEDIVLIAHNNDSFDKPLMENEFARHKVEIPKWRYFDSLKWARRYRPDLPRHTLQHLREVYGFAENNAHRALDDVIILHKVFMQMVDDLNIETVLHLMSQKGPKVRVMPFGKHAGKPLKTVPANYVQWLSKSGAFDKPGSEELKQAFGELGML
ncbi:MAG: DUF3820 family protein [Chlamydiales bacterium]